MTGENHEEIIRTGNEEKDDLSVTLDTDSLQLPSLDAMMLVNEL